MSSGPEEGETDQIQQQLPQLEHEHCPNCQRRFFPGKLQLHLKLCSPLSPMISPTRTHRPTPHLSSSKHSFCPHCHTQLPQFLIETHIAKYHQSAAIESPRTYPTPAEGRENPETGKQWGVERKEVKKEKAGEESPRRYRVKVREELSCLRLAEQVQKEECPSCGRMFSREAALRHIPVCQKLAQQQHYVQFLGKRGKKDKKGEKNKKGYSQSSPGSPRRNQSLLVPKKKVPLPPLHSNHSTFG